MSVSRLFTLSVLWLLLTVQAGLAGEQLGAHFRAPDEFQQVIDTRCLNCHDRQRIEQAIRRQMALDPLQNRMLGHGAILTQGDREILGTFWGSPLKERTR
ncbi:MAG: hypothetical protein IH614_11860 [Desulfuromonadales bacterium]|nr:hypothetical protein [Desulfuromonadales bacterium]